MSYFVFSLFPRDVLDENRYLIESVPENFTTYIFSFVVSRFQHLLYLLIKHFKDYNTISFPEVIKLFSCSTELSMKFFLLIHVKMPTIVGILKFMSRKNSILGLSEPKKC